MFDDADGAVTEPAGSAKRPLAYNPGPDAGGDQVRVRLGGDSRVVHARRQDRIEERPGRGEGRWGVAVGRLSLTAR